MPTIILGGGVAGLSAQHFSLVAPIVLERNNVVGGGCRIVEVDGHTYPLGPRKLRYREPTKKVVDEVLREFGMQRFKVVDERSLVRYRGRYVGFPFQHNLRDLPLLERLACLFGYVTRPTGTPKNFNHWARAKYGNYVAETVVLPHSERSWKRASHEISLRATSKVMEGGPLEFVKGLFVSQNIDERMIYIQGGVAELFNRMAEKYRPNIYTGVSVKRGAIDLDRQRIYFGGDFYPRGFQYERLVSTIPLPAFFHLVKPGTIPPELELAFELLDYNILFIVYVLVTKDGYIGPEKTRMIYYPEPGPVFHRVSMPSHDGVHPPEDYHAIVAEVTVDRKYRRLTKSADYIRMLKAQVLRDLRKCRLLTDSGTTVKATDVSVISPGYILFDKYYESALRRIKNFFEAKNVHFLGRFAEWNNLEIDTTLAKAKAMMGVRGFA